MTAREASGAPALRCAHCGRAVRGTVHTRTSYRVDYYTLYSGHGEPCTVGGDDRHQPFSYVRLLDRFDVVTCVDCYGQAVVRAERDRQFHPERAATPAREDA